MKNIVSKAQQEIYKKFAINIQVFLRGAKTKGEQYDKFRDTGYVKEYKNSVFIKAIKKTISANGLVYKDLGLVETGAIEVIVKNSDVNFIKLSEKIIVNGLEYNAYNQALGNKVQMFPSESGFTRIILFLRGM